MKLVEGDLEFDFSKATTARVFDDQTHGLSHCMKAVDFLVEHLARQIFIEVKDPAHPNAAPKQKQAFLTKLNDGTLYRDLATKYRDTFLYEHCSGRLHAPPTYVVMIALPLSATPTLTTHTKLLQQQLPTKGPLNRPWPTALSSGCVVLDLNAWAAKFPEFPVRRVSACAQPQP